MKRSGRLLGLLSGFSILLVSLFLPLQGRDVVLRTGLEEGLQALAHRDAELTHGVLQARAGLLVNYDSLTQSERKVREGLQSLRQASAAARGDTATEIGPPLDALTQEIHAKLALVEYFKSEHALLRKSATFVTWAESPVGEPPSGEVLATHARAIAEGSSRIDVLVHQIVSAPVSTRVEAVRDVVARHSGVR